MEITKERVEREGCYNFYLNEGEKILSITFGGNLDLYWSLHIKKEKIDKDNILKKDLKKIMYGEIKGTFIITKENYFIYSLFEDLYEDIKNARIFEPIRQSEEKLDIDEESNLDILKIMTEKDIAEKNALFKNREYYKLLFDGEKVEWHSDEEYYDIANRVIIRKVDDNFALEFIRPEMTEDKCFYFSAPGSISIRFRNSGSLYDPFNMIFMRMFNKLQNYDPEYHQIHFEEINYAKKLSLKK